MKLTDRHIDYINNNLRLYGVKSEPLREDLLDHICTYIENQESDDFEKLYQDALHEFGGYASFQNLQLETNFQKFASQSLIRKKILFSAATIALLSIFIGSLFKIMHWPFASILLFVGFMILLIIVIPLFFYDRYKSVIHKFS